MTPEQEKHFIAALYERLWQIIIYKPNSTQQEAFDHEKIFLHLSKGEALNPADFMNLLTPRNPTGDLRASELFSRMVDVIPEIKADYNPSCNHVSTVYQQILEGTNSSIPVDPNQEEIYKRAYTFLYADAIVQDYTGREITLQMPSQRVQVYENNKFAYVQAVSNYRTAYLNYDLSNLQQQREWLANAPLLELAINQAYNKWRQEGAAQVEQARAVLETSTSSKTKSTLKSLIRQSLEIMNTSAFASVNEDEKQWYLTYALPTDWAVLSSNVNFSHLNFKSSYPQKIENSRFNIYGGGQSWSDGLWCIENPSSSDLNSAHYHLEANEVNMTAKISVVRFYRLWFNLVLLKMIKQLTNVIDRESITFPLLIPTAFITAHNIQIKADFTSKDREILEQSFSGATDVSLGPIRLSGRYSHSLSVEKFHSTEDAGIVIVPGIHVLAWISEIMPASES
jgi:hypothetical protein